MARDRNTYSALVGRGRNPKRRNGAFPKSVDRLCDKQLVKSGGKWYSGIIPLDDIIKEAGGMGSPLFDSDTYRLTTIANFIDISTDSATLLTELEEVINLWNNKRISELADGDNDEGEEVTATAVTSLATKVLTDAKIIAEMILDSDIREMTKITKSDASSAAPFTSGTRAGLESEIFQMYFHPLSLTLAYLWTTMIQYQAPEPVTGKSGCYLTVVRKGVTAANMETHIGNSKAELLAANVANVLGTPLRQLKPDFFEKRMVVSAYSDYALWALSFAPVRDDAGLSDYEFDGSEPVSIHFNQSLPLSMLLMASAIFRDSAATATPGWIVSQTPSAGKMSLTYAGPTSTSWTEFTDTNDWYDWIRLVATRRSVDQTGLAGNTHMPYLATKTFNISSAAGWNTRLTDFLIKFFDIPWKPAGNSLNTFVDSIGRRMKMYGSYGIRMDTSDPITFNMFGLNQGHLSNAIKGRVSNAVRKALDMVKRAQKLNGVPANQLKALENIRQQLNKKHDLINEAVKDIDFEPILHVIDGGADIVREVTSGLAKAAEATAPSMGKAAGGFISRFVRGLF